MPNNNRKWRRTRLKAGIYMQPNGKYSVCVMIDRKPRFRTVDARTIEEARRRPAPGFSAFDLRRSRSALPP